jgi:hypothetical protein
MPNITSSEIESLPKKIGEKAISNPLVVSISPVRPRSLAIEALGLGNTSKEPRCDSQEGWQLIKTYRNYELSMS